MAIQEHCPVFLSAQTPLGLVSRLGQLCDPQRFDTALLLKGGGRTARCGLVERLAKTAQEAGHTVCRVLCCDDPTRTEAAFWGRVAVLDADAPHAVEPRHAGVVEQLLWLGDPTPPDRRAALLALYAQERTLREQARRYLCAACTLWEENRRLVREATDAEKIQRQAKRLLAQLPAPQEAFSPLWGEDGAVLFSTANGYALPALAEGKLAPICVALEDAHGVAAALLLDALRRGAAARGLQVIAGYSPFAPYERIEQLLLPQCGVAFCTVNERLPAPAAAPKVINARRFTDRKRLTNGKNRLAFNRKAARQMQTQAAALLAEAESCRAALDAALDAATPAQTARQRLQQAAQLLGL